MGYYINLSDSDFFIPGDKKEQALKAIKDATPETRFSWIDNATILKCITLEEAMSKFRWPVELSEDMDSGDINGINFDGEKSGSEDELFTLLAPFVRHGSWIEISGEDGNFWRSYFLYGKYHSVEPTITWNIEDIDP